VTRLTLFAALVFVALKERLVINLRIVNKLIILDAYPMPLQFNLIKALKGKIAILVINSL
jgi:hypothetical protein